MSPSKIASRENGIICKKIKEINTPKIGINTRSHLFILYICQIKINQLIII